MKSEKGSITIFVITSALFITLSVIAMGVSMSNKQVAQKEQIKQIQEQYSVNNDQLEEAYNKAIKTKE